MIRDIPIPLFFWRNEIIKSYSDLLHSLLLCSLSKSDAFIKTLQYYSERSYTLYIINDTIASQKMSFLSSWKCNILSYLPQSHAIFEHEALIKYSRKRIHKFTFVTDLQIPPLSSAFHAVSRVWRWNGCPLCAEF